MKKRFCSRLTALFSAPGPSPLPADPASGQLRVHENDVVPRPANAGPGNPVVPVSPEQPQPPPGPRHPDGADSALRQLHLHIADAAESAPVPDVNDFLASQIRVSAWRHFDPSRCPVYAPLPTDMRAKAGTQPSDGCKAGPGSAPGIPGKSGKFVKNDKNMIEKQMKFCYNEEYGASSVVSDSLFGLPALMKHIHL